MVPIKVSYAYCEWSDREEVRKKVNKFKPEIQEDKQKEKRNDK